jgi:hypothetical protein
MPLFREYSGARHFFLKDFSRHKAVPHCWFMRSLTSIHMSSIFSALYVLSYAYAPPPDEN